jgi:hypothetical protein
MDDELRPLTGAELSLVAGGLGAIGPEPVFPHPIWRPEPPPVNPEPPVNPGGPIVPGQGCMPMPGYACPL